MFWVYCPTETGSCVHTLSRTQENWLLVLWAWKFEVLMLLAKTCRELHLLRNNTVLFLTVVTLGGVLACLNGSFAACCRRMKLRQLPPPAFSLCRLSSSGAVTPDVKGQLSPQSVAWQNGRPIHKMDTPVMAGCFMAGVGLALPPSCPFLWCKCWYLWPLSRPFLTRKGWWYRRVLQCLSLAYRLVTHAI